MRSAWQCAILYNNNMHPKDGHSRFLQNVADLLDQLPGAKKVREL
jgi:hypothetical protein